MIVSVFSGVPEKHLNLVEAGTQDRKFWVLNSFLKFKKLVGDSGYYQNLVLYDENLLLVCINLREYGIRRILGIDHYEK